LENEEVKDEQGILKAEVWRSGSNKDDMKWKKAEYRSRVCNEGTILLIFEGLEKDSNYDVRVLCESKNGQVILLTNNKLHTEGE